MQQYVFDLFCKVKTEELQLPLKASITTNSITLQYIASVAGYFGRMEN